MSGVGLMVAMALVAKVLEGLGACPLPAVVWLAWGALVLVLLG